jgi:hypothetical protein
VLHSEADVAKKLVRAPPRAVCFALKLGSEPASLHRGDIEALRANGLTDEQILEVVLMTALTNFLCTLSAGLEWRRISSRRRFVSPFSVSLGLWRPPRQWGPRVLTCVRLFGTLPDRSRLGGIE